MNYDQCDMCRGRMYSHDSVWSNGEKHHCCGDCVRYKTDMRWTMVRAYWPPNFEIPNDMQVTGRSSDDSQG